MKQKEGQCTARNSRTVLQKVLGPQPANHGGNWFREAFPPELTTSQPSSVEPARTEVRRSGSHGPIHKEQSHIQVCPPALPASSQTERARKSPGTTEGASSLQTLGIHAKHSLSLKQLLWPQHPSNSFCCLSLFVLLATIISSDPSFFFSLFPLLPHGL